MIWIGILVSVGVVVGGLVDVADVLMPRVLVTDTTTVLAHIGERNVENVAQRAHVDEVDREPGIYNLVHDVCQCMAV